jgi:hypothetical protein
MPTVDALCVLLECNQSGFRIYHGIHIVQLLDVTGFDAIYAMCHPRY